MKAPGIVGLVLAATVTSSAGASLDEQHLSLSNCRAICQIHGVHALWTSNDRGNHEADREIPSHYERMLDTTYAEHGQENKTATDGVWTFTCRTLWDRTIGTRKYLPFHEVGLTDSLVEVYGRHSLESGDWSLCYGGGSLEKQPSNALLPMTKRNETRAHSLRPRERPSHRMNLFVLPDTSQLILTNATVAFGSSRGLMQNRKLVEPAYERTGTKTILVVRITDSRTNSEPSASLDSLKSAIFGPLTSSARKKGLVTVADQYFLISHGSLKFVPATFPNQNVMNGVMDVSFRGFDGSGVQFLTNDLVQATESALKLNPAQDLSELVHHTIFCLPDNVYAPLNGNIADWTAFTYIYHPFSFFRRDRCTKLSVVMHELGHASLGFQHAGSYIPTIKSGGSDGTMVNGLEMREDEYADETGYMGYSNNQFGKPRKAMNSHKHWYSGWFSDNAMQRLDPLQGHIHLEMVGYTQYRQPDWTVVVKQQRNKVVLLRIGDFYLQYNYVSQSSFMNWNADTAYPNAVTIVKAIGDSVVSYLVGYLEPGLTHVESNYMNTGKSVVIHACPSHMTDPQPSIYVDIYIQENGIPPSLCVTQTKAPTIAPISYKRRTTAPAPTLHPTQHPTEYPRDTTLPPHGKEILVEREGPPLTGAGVTTALPESSKSSSTENAILFGALALLVFIFLAGAACIFIYVKIIRKMSARRKAAAATPDPKILPKRTSLALTQSSSSNVSGLTEESGPRRGGSSAALKGKEVTFASI